MPVSEDLRETFCRRALRYYMEPARSENKLKQNGFFLQKRLTIAVDLQLFFEAL